MSARGGALSRDLTEGYGPQEYMIRKAPGGICTIKANFYGSDSVKVIGAVTVQVRTYTNFGRKNKNCRSISVQLRIAGDMITIGRIKL